MLALSAVGAPSLRSIVARYSAARVLDLHGLALEPPADPGYRDKPMFQHPVLNRAIVAKHFLRSDEGLARWNERRIAATKLIFPFDANDLRLGGQFVYIDETAFEEQLHTVLQFDEAAMERDLRVLRILDRLPTLDPFLLRESLADHRIDVAQCYFRFGPLDREEMLGFVSRELQTLISLSFGVLPPDDPRPKRLSELLLGNGDSPELEPLRVTLKMTAEEFSEAMFSWKAVLYYRWKTRSLAPKLRATRKSIAVVDQQRFKSELAPFVKNATHQLETVISTASRQIARTFTRYDEAFRSMTARLDPEEFRGFLTQGGTMFRDLGEQVGRLEQITSFWMHQFPHPNAAIMTPEAVLDGVRDLLNAMSAPPRSDASAGREAVLLNG